ncbi:MAG TPA: LCP family protein [Candidatus Saccharimonadia bacterium]|nr:LCP family protein [Candidatus Saccharimonadia bacterium]
MDTDPERDLAQFKPADGQPSPAAPTTAPARPMARPRPPRRARAVLWRMFWFIVLAVLAGVVVYAVYIVNIVAKISTNSWQLGPLAADASGRTNILVMGVGDPGHAGQNLSDTMMVLSLDGTAHRLAEISIPRDLRVNIEGYGYGKINTANAYGGVSLAEDTVSQTFDVPIDYYVKTNFSGLKEVVDAVGGLDVDVKDRLRDTEYPCDDDQYKVCGLDIEPGSQHMDGTTVLQYVRCRKGTCGNDFGRAARQQEVLGLLRPKVTDWHLILQPAKLKQLVTAVQHGVETNMGIAQLLQLGNGVREAGANEPVNLVLSTANGGYLRGDPTGGSDLLPIGGDFSAISERVKNIFGAP